MAAPSVILALLLYIGIAIFLVENGPLSTSAIHPERQKLLRSAVRWLALRRNGQPMTNDDRGKLFHRRLYRRYRKTDFYRTLVIAFHEGVIPKLTLNLNENCDPSYTTKYKDPISGSVAYGYQIKFIFEAYDNRKLSRDQFCDYRKGLVCNPTSRKCECPQGSNMHYVHPNLTISETKRCLLEENEICGMIDMEHGNDQNHTLLAENMKHLVFNFEKPLSCKLGTVCRFKPSDLKAPRCYDINSGPWAPPITDAAGNTVNDWPLGYGEECILDLFATPGSCKFGTNGLVGVTGTGSYVCHNFGPRRSLGSSNFRNITGFCANVYAPYGTNTAFSIIVYQKWWHPLFSSFITPRTVPFKGIDLENYMRNVSKGLRYFSIRSGGIQSTTEGEKCNIKKTAQMEDLWKYFSSLENKPPPGQDYVPEATPAMLNSKLDEFLALTDFVSNPGRVCKVMHHFDVSGYPSPLKSYPSLKCVPVGSQDADGNDGECTAPGNLDTLQFAEKFQKFLDAEHELTATFYEYGLRRDILRAHPEDPLLECSEASPICLGGYVCYEDYNDILLLYEDNCKFKAGKSPSLLDHHCHEDRDDLAYGKCEDEHLNQRALQEFERMASFSRLGMGDACHHDLEMNIRNWIQDGLPPPNLNRYKLLANLRDIEISAPGAGGLCDRSRLLECTPANVCECVEDFEPRKTIVGGEEYQSDYCYQTSGPCKEVEKIGSLTMTEKMKIRDHYGEACVGGNQCVFIDESGTCTTKNTGDTGHDGSSVTTSTRKPGTGPLPAAAPESLRGSRFVFTLCLLLIFLGIPSVYDSHLF